MGPRARRRIGADLVGLRLGTEVVRLDFKGGIRVRVETSGSDGLRMSIVGFRMTATNPTLGDVTISQSDTELTPLSLLHIPALNESMPHDSAHTA